MDNPETYVVYLSMLRSVTVILYVNYYLTEVFPQKNTNEQSNVKNQIIEENELDNFLYNNATYQV